MEAGDRALPWPRASAGRCRRRRPAHPCRGGGPRRVRHRDRMRIWPAASGIGEAAVAAPRRDRRPELKLLAFAAAVLAVLALAVLGEPTEFQIGEEAIRPHPSGVA